MIDISGRATRAGTRGIAVLAAVAGFAVLPQLAHGGPARAEGPARHHHPRGEDRHDQRATGQRPRVALNAMAPHGRIVPGRTYRWPYAVTNNGTTPVRHVTLETAPNRDLKVVATPPRCAWHRRAVLVCRVGLIPRGHTRRGSITARVDPKAHLGKSLSSPARLSWQDVPAAAGSQAAAFPPVAVSPTTDLTVRSTAPEQVGSTDAPYRISVTNDGPVTAESVVVRTAVAPQHPDSRAQRLNTLACGGGCAGQRPDVPACGGGCAPPRPDAAGCRTGSCGIPSCACRSARPVEEAAPRLGRCGEQGPCGSCSPCSLTAGPARAPAPSDRHAGSCGRDCGAAPVDGSGIATHPRDRAVPVLIRHHRRCVADGTGFVCPLGPIPPGRTRTLRLAVHGRPGAPAHRFRCLSTVRSGTPDSNMANNRSACHTHRAHPLPARAGTPARRNAQVRRLPATGSSSGVLALWGLGLAGAGLALFGLGRRRRGEHG